MSKRNGSIIVTLASLAAAGVAGYVFCKKDGSRKVRELARTIMPEGLDDEDEPLFTTEEAEAEDVCEEQPCEACEEQPCEKCEEKTCEEQPDTAALDLDGDGEIDAVAIDVDGDGDADVVLVDTDEDGCADAVVELEEKPEEK